MKKSWLLASVLLTSCASQPQPFGAWSQYYYDEVAKSEARHMQDAEERRQNAARWEIESEKRISEMLKSRPDYVTPPTSEERAADALENIGFQMEMDRNQRELEAIR